MGSDFLNPTAFIFNFSFENNPAVPVYLKFLHKLLLKSATDCFTVSFLVNLISNQKA
ncbi:hypothetical protein C723_1377 [Christiangramia flava JLT2011]|uniref:Uncharacterized protein n=1 Tax=Christiangramia flava JLT2011 TaxID=1229726 RepID=A0A1L7I8U0_9FLAO|nr:hypothetical protein GRFL_3266 [Christiangramia flava JLT2011]OSS39475.1 hypothetical protein C723_1377 [Christiangramia flava JLT2011]